jgi:RNA-binding protein YlmH
VNRVNNNLFQHFKGYESLIKKLNQLQEKYDQTDGNISLGFCNSGEITTIKSILADKIPYNFFGGYDEAIRKICIIGEDIDFKDYICCLAGSYNKKFNKLTHRDIKGAIYNSGIDLNKFGDMWVDDDKIYFYCCKDVKNYLQNNLNRIGRCTVKFEEVEFKKQIFKFEEYKYIVSSARLDSVVSALIRKSREKAKDFINAGFVNVNYQTIEDFTYLCNNNDILSLRTHGRYRIIDIEKNKKSGKIIIKVKKFI